MALRVRELVKLREVVKAKEPVTQGTRASLKELLARQAMKLVVKPAGKPAGKQAGKPEVPLQSCLKG